MELTHWSYRRLPGIRFAIHLQLPLYMCLMLCLPLGITVIVAGATALTRFQTPGNPFAAYDDLISGNTQDPAFGSNHETLLRAVFDVACTTSLVQKYCYYQPESGPFAVIQFHDLNREGERGIYFDVRDNALTVGDLALLWGRPEITQHENSLVLHWPDQHMSTVVRSDSGQFSYFLPVPYLMLRD
jgi:hypothetical protein